MAHALAGLDRSARSWFMDPTVWTKSPPRGPRRSSRSCTSRAKFLMDTGRFRRGPASVTDLIGGDRAQNQKIAIAVLEGERGPRRDIVLVNAPLLCWRRTSPSTPAQPCVKRRNRSTPERLGKVQKLANFALKFSDAPVRSRPAPPCCPLPNPADLPETLPAEIRTSRRRPSRWRCARSVYRRRCHPP